MRVRGSPDQSDRDLIQDAVDRIEIVPDLIRVTLTAPLDGDPHRLDIPWRRTSFRRHREVIASPGREGPTRPMRVETRATLLAAIAKGRRWLDEIVDGKVAGPDAIASREGCSSRQVNATISLAHLAPDIVEAAITGRLSHGTGLRELTDPPAEWSRQRVLAGLGAVDLV